MVRSRYREALRLLRVLRLRLPVEGYLLQGGFQFALSLETRFPRVAI